MNFMVVQSNFSTFCPILTLFIARLTGEITVNITL